MAIKGWKLKNKRNPTWYQHESVLGSGAGIIEIDSLNGVYHVVYDEKISEGKWKRHLKEHLNKKEAFNFAKYWMKKHPDG